jgi:hypothetical protein
MHRLDRIRERVWLETDCVTTCATHVVVCDSTSSCSSLPSPAEHGGQQCAKQCLCAAISRARNVPVWMIARYVYEE